jgi:putative CRISPR-associated protein (TIGR02620 family)
LDCVVVTRHQALVAYLQEIGLISGGAAVLLHATPEDIRGKRVIGVLPLRLAAEAETVTEVPLDLPAELRGQELTLEQIRQYAGQPQTYKVQRI